MTHSARAQAALALLAAVLWCSAARAGLDEGLAALARRDYVAAEKELRPLAERGNAEAQYRIGLMYEFGRGYPVDKAQGIAWFRKAAAQGNTSAQQELGVIYTTGDGVPKDDKEAVAWFERAANLGNPTAQFNLGLMIAKGAGTRRDDAQAIAWFRKSAMQGFAPAQFKLGVAYENGEGVPRDAALAYASYAIAARGGNAEYAAKRDEIAAKLSPAQAKQAQAVAGAWTPGQAMPTSLAAAGATGTATASGTQAKERCSATGMLGGEKFTATHCAVALYGDQNSVAIWFNEEPITPDEVAGFQVSSYAEESKNGKPRTRVQIMICPGGRGAVAAPAALKEIDLNTNHAKSPLAGVQWVLAAPKDFKVEKLTGEIKPGAMLSGRIVGGREKTSLTLDFDLILPAKDAAAGRSCGK